MRSLCVELSASVCLFHNDVRVVEVDYIYMMMSLAGLGRSRINEQFVLSPASWRGTAAITRMKYVEVRLSSDSDMAESTRLDASLVYSVTSRP